MQPGRKIFVEVHGDEDSDRRRVVDLAADLRQDLLALDVDEVAYPAAVSPANSKGTAFEWAQLVITLAGTTPPLLAALRGWLARHDGAAVTLEVDGDRVLLDELDEEQARIATAWFARNAL